MERVVITGLGTVNAVSKNISEYATALKEGRCGVGPISVFDTTDYRTHTGGEVTDFDPRKMIPKEFRTHRMSRADLLAFAAAVEALSSAGLFPFPEELASDTGVIIGGGAGGMLQGEEFFREYITNGPERARFSKMAPLHCAASADHIASKFSLFGPKTTFMTACSSSANAMGYAADLIRDGVCRVAVTGGTEPLSRITYAGFNSLRSVDPEYPKPFDKNRQGLSLGEGAGIVILEALSYAKERGANIFAEFLGYGVTCDAHHMTAPDPDAGGAARSMRAALNDAGIDASRIDYINAHGTATPANDAVETAAIKAVFGKRAYDVPVSSTKSMIGHTLGAAGALEAVASILAMNDGFIPPTIHYSEPDPECDLDYVTEGAREGSMDIFLSNSFAFGGNNTTIIIGRFTEEGVTHE
ncbi:MAG: beta-ketoacyl-[acyl-carrier-protein] synthase family protein [Deltaproteobacteria bacterium]|nr:beta-ketoacyl-[acyl-carrier-protein] synthase family protein [Candidatus Zymogenaceae bacterium]